MDPSPASQIRAANSRIIAHQDLSAIPGFFTEDYVVHVTEQNPGGHELVRRFVRTLLDAFTDLEIEIEILIEGEDRVAWQRTLRGTQTGAFMGFPATGRRVVWRDMITTRFRDGLIAEEWAITDLAERLLLARKG